MYGPEANGDIDIPLEENGTCWTALFRSQRL